MSKREAIKVEKIDNEFPPGMEISFHFSSLKASLPLDCRPRAAAHPRLQTRAEPT